MSVGRGKAPDASRTVSAKPLEAWEVATTALGFTGSRGGGFQMHDLARRVGGRQDLVADHLNLVEMETLRQALLPFARLAERVNSWATLQAAHVREEVGDFPSPPPARPEPPPRP